MLIDSPMLTKPTTRRCARSCCSIPVLCLWLVQCTTDQAAVTKQSLSYSSREDCPSCEQGPGSAADAADSAPPQCADGACDVGLDLDRLRVDNAVLAAQAGCDATPAPGQPKVLNGTDLGWTFTHRDKIWVMFGDSFWNDPLNLASHPDDALATISLSDFPDGASVEAYVHEHPAPSGEPAWHAAGPPLHVVQAPSAAGFAPVISERDGKRLRAGIGAVPTAAFSNGRSGDAEGVFAVFFHYETLACDAGRCPDGYECDSGLGISALQQLNPPCVVGATADCVSGPGLCQDRSSNRYDPSSDTARSTSVVVFNDVGVTTESAPTLFKTQPWKTARFLNVTARTVTDFDATRPSGAGNDYAPALGDDLARAGVFMWGRPFFGGIASEGRDVRLYLLWAPMPVPDAEQHFAWKPLYFTGLDAEQRPQFSERELDARALDLDAEAPGEQPQEIHDLTGQMSISWLPRLQRFVMFYGGDAPSSQEEAIALGDSGKAERDPLGRMWLRFAKHPWGPWTAPRPLMAAGDRELDAAPVEQYAPGGILAHNNCNQADCALYNPIYYLDVGGNNNGVLYGPSIVDAWTTEQQSSSTVYWLVSTWNPYQVVLMKTTMRFD